eukprot:TRINITY_DN24725_c0_g1_i1.p1 TRINITY_DN24725_c0_g1~~TRINITY_DN24725_c0_g1_i1.p1  ORF type:complete len:328 (+),score=46.30 TRINITY_DN24725_c0_g1_i1:41-1024(+)
MLSMTCLSLPVATLALHVLRVALAASHQRLRGEPHLHSVVRKQQCLDKFEQRNGDGTVPSPRPIWHCQDLHTEYVEEANACSDQQPCPLLFVGDSILETLRGTSMGIPLLTPPGFAAMLCTSSPSSHPSLSKACHRLADQQHECTARQRQRESAFYVLDEVEAATGSRPKVFAVGGDATQHMLWRLKNGELPASLQPHVIFVLAGINNMLHGANAFDAQEGALNLLRFLRKVRPEAHIVVHALLPTTHASFEEVSLVNDALKSFADADASITFLNCGHVFLTSGNSTVSEALMPDGVHPGYEGHRMWARCYTPTLKALLNAKHEGAK